MTLDGSASADPDGAPAPLTYRWRFVSLPAGSGLSNGQIADAEQAQSRFTPDVVGSYVLELAVFDGASVDFDNVLVVVRAPVSRSVSAAGHDLRARRRDRRWSRQRQAVPWPAPRHARRRRDRRHPGDDRIAGNGGNDVICGGDGDDVIDGGSGHDMIDGGPGNDIIKTHGGNDYVLGGDGNDTVEGGPGNDVMQGALAATSSRARRATT